MTDSERKPLTSLYNRGRLDDRQVNELLGIANGIIADGVVNQAEAEFLRNWLAANVAAHDNPLVATLLDRVHVMLADGVLDNDESQELLDTLTRFSGGDIEPGELLKSTSLPLDDPPPTIAFSESVFAFSGTCAYGTRRDCRAAIKQRGGVTDELTQRTDYLIVGAYATDAWAHSAFGRKIEKAVDYRSRLGRPAIIDERDWVMALESA